MKKKKAQEVIPVNPKAKDTFFKRVYSNEERRRILAAFLLGVESEKITAASVRPILFGSRENDLAFLCDGIFYIMMEEQSTISSNLPYRILEYVVVGLRSTVDSEKLLYGKSRVIFPVPKLYVLQVGLEIDEDKLPENVRYDLRLSESYIPISAVYCNGDMGYDLEAVVHVYDFRMTLAEILVYIENGKIPKRFDTYDENMKHYALTANWITYMQKIGNRNENKKYTAPKNISTVAEYLKLLLDRGIFVDLLSDKEVCDMTMAQFSRDDMLIYRGREEGTAEAIIELLEDVGEVTDSLKNLIMEQNDIVILKKWLKIAAKAETIKDFEATIGLVV